MKIFLVTVHGRREIHERADGFVAEVAQTSVATASSDGDSLNSTRVQLPTHERLLLFKSGRSNRFCRLIGKALFTGLLLSTFITSLPSEVHAQTSAIARLNDKTYWVGNTWRSNDTDATAEDNAEICLWDADDLCMLRNGAADRILSYCNFVETSMGDRSQVFGSLGSSPLRSMWMADSGGGLACAANNSHVFLLGRIREQQSGAVYMRHYITRYNIGNGAVSSFTGSDDEPNRRFLYRSLFQDASNQEPYTKMADFPGGICVNGTNRVYVADPINRKILAFSNPSGTDGTTLQFLPNESFTVDGFGNVPRKMALDTSGNLWVIQRVGAGSAEPNPNYTHRVCKYSLSTRTLQDAFSRTGWKPTDIEIINQGGVDKIYISDAGPTNQVVRYRINADTGKAAFDNWTLGVANGVWAGPVLGATGNDRFARPGGVAVDRDGNIYVVTNGWGLGEYDRDSRITNYQAHDPAPFGCTIYKFDSSKVFQWKIEGLHHMDALVPDPNNFNILYSKDLRYQVNYADVTSEGVNHNGWTNTHWTIDEQRYPNDPRVRFNFRDSVQARRLSSPAPGQLLLYTLGIRDVTAYRFLSDSDSIARPSAMFTSYSRNTEEVAWPPGCPRTLNSANKDTYLWVDSNGNGQFDATDQWNAVDSATDSIGEYNAYVDAQGSIWVAEKERRNNKLWLHRFWLPTTPLLANGAPAYSGARHDRWDLVGLSGGTIRDLTSMSYNAATDQLCIGINRTEPSDPVQDYETFRRLRLYDNFVVGPRTLRWERSIPHTISPTGGAEGSRENSFKPRGIDLTDEHVFVAYDFRAFPDNAQGEILAYGTSDGHYSGAVQPQQIAKDNQMVDIMRPIHVFRRPGNKYLLTSECNPGAKLLYYQLELALDRFEAATNTTFGGGTGWNTTATTWKRSAGTSTSIITTADGSYRGKSVKLTNDGRISRSFPARRSGSLCFVYRTEGLDSLDRAKVDVKEGSTWRTVFNTAVNQAAWQNITVNIGSTNNADVTEVRFVVENNDGNTADNFFVDDVEILGE
jgi:hypothetical protein